MIRLLQVIMPMLLVAACADGTPVESKTAPAQPQRGWYIEHAGRSEWQPCASSVRIPIPQSGELPAHARAFGLTDDTPVYAEIDASREEDGLHVSRVRQFGSQTPVRDCAMSGVVTPDE